MSFDCRKLGSGFSKIAGFAKVEGSAILNRWKADNTSGKWMQWVVVLALSLNFGVAAHEKRDLSPWQLAGDASHCLGVLLDRVEVLAVHEGRVVAVTDVNANDNVRPLAQGSNQPVNMVTVL